MPPTLDLVTVDKSWVDVVLRVPSLPRADQKVLAESLGRFPGGMGGNVACAASRLGLRTGAVSWVGDDDDGRRVLDDLQRYGVDATHVVVEPGTITNYTSVLVDASGEKAIVIVPTAFNTLDLTPDLIAYLSAARVVYSTAYDLDQLARVSAVVRAAGGLVATDLEPVALDEALLDQALRLVDIAVVNGLLIEDDDWHQMAHELQRRGPRLAVLTFGARGAVASTDEEIVDEPAFEVDVIDTTGAGDCFCAALLAATLRELPLRDALRYANAAAAISIGAFGARGRLPTDGEVRAFLAERSTQTP